MKKIKALLGLILLLFFSRSSLVLANTPEDQDEQLFQQKSQLVLKTLADKPTIPQDGAANPAQFFITFVYIINLV